MMVWVAVRQRDHLLRYPLHSKDTLLLHSKLNLIVLKVHGICVLLTRFPYTRQFKVPGIYRNNALAFIPPEYLIGHQVPCIYRPGSDP